MTMEMTLVTEIVVTVIQKDKCRMVRSKMLSLKRYKDILCDCRLKNLKFYSCRAKVINSCYY